MSCHCSSNLTLPWQPYFDRQFFQKFEFNSFNGKVTFILLSFTFSYHLSGLFCFYYFLANFNGFLRLWKKPEIQVGGPKVATKIEMKT